MPELNVLAVAVAAVAAFVASAVWYALWGRELAKVSAAFAEGLRQRQPWKLLVVLVEHLVIAAVLAYVIARMGPVGWPGAAIIGALLWLGLAATQWVGAMVWEKTPWQMAAIHAGDWLVKLVLIAAIVGAWR
jgi:Protein of unknown function (DUF1761)